MKKRESNYDLLRIISTFTVILLHVNAIFINFDCMYDGYNNIIKAAVDILTRFAVPCFVMSSGAFLLNNAKNKNFKEFYAKTFYKIGIPFLIAVSLLFLYSVVTCILWKGDLLKVVRDLLAGDIYNLWFMYMLVGLYIVTPIIIRFKESVSNKAYIITSIVWMFFAIVSQLTTTYKLAYSFGVVFSYLAYFILGNVLYENCRKYKNSILFFLASILTFAFVFIFRFITGFNEKDYILNQYKVSFIPSIVLASVFLFIAFSNIKINTDFKKLPEKTYIIYLYHSFVYNMIFIIMDNIGIPINEMVTIPVVTILTFVISWVVSTVYLKIWQALEKKFSLKEKWFSKFNT